MSVDDRLKIASINDHPRADERGLGPQDLEQRRRRTEAVQLSLVDAISHSGAMGYLNALVRQFAIVMDAKHALIAEVIPCANDKIKTIAFWSNGDFADSVEIGISGAPYEKVMGRSTCIYKKDIKKLFPDDGVIAAMDAESFIGTPLFDAAGNALGLIAAIDDKPILDAADARLVLSIYATRAGIELKRKRTEDELKRINEGLENRVQQRTYEITEANERLRREILDRQRTEEALRLREEMYRTLAESAQDLIYIIDRNYCVQYLNGFAAMYLGVGQLDVTGRPMTELFPSLQAEYMRNRLQEVFLTGNTFFEEKKVEMKGRTIWLGTRLNPVRASDGTVSSVLGITRDITERMNWTVGLQIERDRAQNYLNVAGVIMLVLNADETVALINKKGCEVLGYTEDEIIGKNWFESFVPENSRDIARRLFRRMIDNRAEGADNDENSVLTREGEERIIDWKSKLLCDESGNAALTLSSGEDITERKLREKERETLITELKDALANIKTLKGLIPICASCKKIRDDGGYWKKLEVYIQEHSEADFSHGVCPDCTKKMLL